MFRSLTVVVVTCLFVFVKLINYPLWKGWFLLYISYTSVSVTLKKILPVTPHHLRNTSWQSFCLSHSIWRVFAATPGLWSSLRTRPGRRDHLSPWAPRPGDCSESRASFYVLSALWFSMKGKPSKFDYWGQQMVQFEGKHRHPGISFDSLTEAWVCWAQTKEGRRESWKPKMV